MFDFLFSLQKFYLFFLIGLPKDVAIRPPSGDVNEFLDSLASNQGGYKKRKRVSSPPNLKKKRPERRYCKPMGGSDALPSDLVHRLSDESEE